MVVNSHIRCWFFGFDKGTTITSEELGKEYMGILLFLQHFFKIQNYSKISFFKNSQQEK